MKYFLTAVCRLLLIATCIFVGAKTCLAADETLTSQLLTIDGQSRAGRLTGLTEKNLQWTAVDGKVQTVELSDVVMVTSESAWPDSLAGGGLVYLLNGDRIAASPVSLDETALTVRWRRYPAWKPLALPLETVRAFLPVVPQLPTPRERAQKLARTVYAGADCLTLGNGDEVTGELAGLADGELSLETAVGKTVVDLTGVQVVRMNAELGSFPPIKGPRMLLTLQDGSWLTLRQGTLDGELMKGKTAFGAEIELPITEVLEIRWLGRRAVWLSEIVEEKYEFQPWFSLMWPLQKNASVVGKELQLQSRNYPLGLGVHSRSVVTYQLDKEYETFQVTAGLDASASAQGSAVFQVAVDGKIVQQTKPLGANSSPESIGPIDVSNSSQLTLTVDYGPRLDISDYGNWCDPVLVRKKP